MDSSNLDRALQSAVLAVRGSARFLRRHRHDPPPPSIKPDGGTVTDLDIRSEQRMRRVLRSRHPDHTIVGEETPMEPGSGGWVWYLDPLDGTRAFSIGQDNCSVAATLTRDGLPLLAAVTGITSGDLYTAVRGRASELNDRPIRVASPRPLSEAELLLYYDMGEPGLTSLYSAAVGREVGRLTVLPGSFILNSCRAASGGHHVFLCVKRNSTALMPWDLSPAALILGGAGGVLQDLEGRAIGGMIPAREVVAGTGEIAAEMIRKFGPRIRAPHPSLGWARRNEGVFARLCGMVLGLGRPCIIGIGGAGGGIGKTTFARELAALLGPEESRVVALDDYLLPRTERDARGVGAHDPAANDLARAAADLAALRSGAPCTKPVYDHPQGGPLTEETISPARFVIAEGVQAMHPTIRPLIDLGVFLDASPAVRYRRVERDMSEKGVSEPYAKAVHRRLEEECRRHLLPLRAAADAVIAVDDSFGLSWVHP